MNEICGFTKFAYVASCIYWHNIWNIVCYLLQYLVLKIIKIFADFQEFLSKHSTTIIIMFLGLTTVMYTTMGLTNPDLHYMVCCIL